MSRKLDYLNLVLLSQIFEKIIFKIFLIKNFDGSKESVFDESENV